MHCIPPCPPDGHRSAAWLKLALIAAIASVAVGDMMRKSIVFDMKTPKVFFCPQEKPTDMSKMIVQAKPLDKL